jgi:carbon storage regulator CsrA
MLVLKLRPGERVIIAGIIFVSVQGIGRDMTVSLGFVAPKEVYIVREELLKKKADR